jgi:Flp pilus assembly protein TadG
VTTTPCPSARPEPRDGPAAAPDRRPGCEVPGTEAGFLSLEWVLTLPVLILLGSLLLAGGFLVRDVVVLQEAARVGARVASVTPGTAAADAAARDAAPELAALDVRVTPATRSAGDDVEVVVASTRRYGPLSHRLTARSVARVEPVVTGVPATVPAPPPPGDGDGGGP